MKNKILLLFFGLCAGFTACTKTGTSEFTDSPIIESYLRPGEHPVIKIARQVPFSPDVNYSTDDINALSINITNNNTSNSMTSLGEGLYVDSSITITSGERYDLSFAYNSKTVSAYTYVPSTPSNFTQSVKSIAIPSFDFSGGFPSTMPTMPDPVSLKWDNKDGSYYIVIIENMEATLSPIRDFGDKAPPSNIFRKPPTVSSGLEVGPMEFQYFGRHRLILFHVLPDYASLYSDTQTSSQNLTNPSTSIVNGYGIFTGLNSDTLFINVTK